MTTQALQQAKEALDEIAGCFEAAFIEGLSDVLAETEDARLKDLIQRRILCANEAAQHAITALAVVSSETQPVALTDEQKTELLDWVSACQSAYHIENTPGHRFGGLGGQLQENREALVEYVESILVAVSPAPDVRPSVPVSDERKPVIRKFFDLPLGTRFRYIGGKDVWVILERHGFGKVAKCEPYDGWVAGQSICSFADTEQECRTLEVEVLAAPAAPVQQEPVAAQPQTQCRYPLCQSEAEQDRIAAEVHASLYSGEVQDTPQEAGQARELPPLPEPWITHLSTKDPAARHHYAEDQMLDYARAAIAQAAPAVQPEADESVLREAADAMHSVLIAGGDYGDELTDMGLRNRLKKSRDALENILTGPPKPKTAPAVPELPDEEIVKVLASLAVDADKSIYDWNPVLQVRTTVPGIRKIVAAYIAAAPSAPGQEGGE